MDNGHDSDCATNNAPAYPAGPCDCMPTQAMCRAAVVYMNGADVYDKLPREVLEIEEGIYAEVWKAMRAAEPANAADDAATMCVWCEERVCGACKSRYDTLTCTHRVFVPTAEQWAAAESNARAKHD